MSKTLGEVISERRKEKKWSLRELADKVKKEDGSAVSPQYLNDIEHGNRKPSGLLIDNLAKALGLDQDLLRVLSGVQPKEMNQNPEVAVEMAKAYRRHLGGDRNALKAIPNLIKKIEDSK